jgi:disulfide bond formation protein DsbB
MNLNLTQRIVFAAGFFACVALMAVALYLQHVVKLEPCPLCILQRIAVIGVGLVMLAGALHNPGIRGRRVYGALTLIVAECGAAVAARHVWLQLVPNRVAECGIGLEDMIEMFPLSKTMELVFRGSGDCSDVQWTFLSLTIPGWMLIVFGGFTVLGLLLVFSRRFAPRTPAPGSLFLR